ncbi:MAG: acyl-CoA synthetase FdrA [Caldilineales bacterium]|nr:acyl-CoA synthetase FdrA [Caldilineales bacterium]MDW8319267.1 acyl-CoA synthetase FdrA [Anaerolineae bacterium]
MVSRHAIRRGVYYDSVVLMQLQRSLAALPGVVDAAVVMATPANRELLESTGFALAGVEAGPEDLLVVVKADDAEAAAAALAEADRLLEQRRAAGPAGAPGAYRPRSLAAAASALPEAHWVLVSVPGRYAAGVAQQALDLGKHVFLYSDNVALADEIALKQQARSKGLLVMGPDCGTAIVNGVGLGFANRVRRGRVGIVAASGTGLQAVASAVHALGEGVSQAIGTGGRDLKAEVGGITALQGLDLLARDPQTDVIVLVSKPPAAGVATALLSAAQATGKPVVVDFIGYPPPARRLGNLHFAANLDEAAELAVHLRRAGKAPPISDGRPPITGYVRGLFSGGTLAVQVLLGLQPVLAPLYSNTPLRPEQALANSLHSQAHTILDLGEDEFTQGRLHPMLDNDLRLRRLRQEAADPEVGLILLDVVLGDGAHPDPAAELAPAIAEVKAARPDLEVAALVVGTDEDPQGATAQGERLAQAGATVLRSAAAAVEYVSRRLQQPYRYPYPALPLAHFGEDGRSLAAINVGLEMFYHSLLAQGAAAVHVDWRPPAGGNEALMAILAKMRSGRREQQPHG